jgi:hypothetical protein
MRLIPLDVKDGPAFYTWDSYDMPEVCPSSGKLPLYQPKNASYNGIQIFYFVYYPYAELNPSYSSRLFRSTTAIEYP